MDQPLPRRRRAGRKKHDPPLKKRLVSITDDQARLLRMWGRGDMSAGLRWLIDQASHFVRKPDPPDAHHSSE